MDELDRDDAPQGQSEPPGLAGFFRRLQGRLSLPREGARIPWRPLRRLLLALLLSVGAVSLWRGTQRSFQAVAPGHVGVCANRFTGSLEALEPGTHFRPPFLYEIHPVRVSDQLLSAEAGLFSVTTKEGVIARITVQARWAVDRRQLLAKWAALPPQPARELVAPVLFAGLSRGGSALRGPAPDFGKAGGARHGRRRFRAAAGGVVLKEVLIEDLVLRRVREGGASPWSMRCSPPSASRMVKRKAKEVEETRP